MRFFRDSSRAYLRQVTGDILLQLRGMRLQRFLARCSAPRMGADNRIVIGRHLDQTLAIIRMAMQALVDTLKGMYTVYTPYIHRRNRRRTSYSSIEIAFKICRRLIDIR